MVSFSANTVNAGNKLVTLLGSQTSIVEKFMLQSSSVAIDATIDTLVTQFDHGKYEQFLLTNSLSNKPKNIIFLMVRRIITSSLGKMTYSGIPLNATIHKAPSQVPTSKKTITVATTSMSLQCTTTGAVRSAIVEVKPLRLVYTNPKSGSFEASISQYSKMCFQYACGPGPHNA